MQKDFEKICTFESLYQAHKKARRGKQNKREVIHFELYLTENLEKLKYHLENQTYAVRGYRKFEIFDPKHREIQALCYGDRVVQHSLCDNVLGPYLENRLIFDNAACRKGKGTHFAMSRLTGFMRDFYKKYGVNGYVLKCDIKKYFNSIHHEVLHKQIQDFQLDEKTKWLLHLIVDSYEFSEQRGIPMGNQTSQWLALYYLDGLDRFIKEKLQIKFYSRYMDDMILIHPDREYLKYCLMEMERYVEEKLHIKFNQKTQMHHIREGVDYLGFHFYLTENGKVIRKLRQSGKKRIKKKMASFRRLYKKDRIASEQVRASLVSTCGHLSHGHTYQLRKNIKENLLLTRGKNNENV